MIITATQFAIKDGITDNANADQLRHHQTAPAFPIYAHNLVVAVAPKVIADLFVVESMQMAAGSLTMIAGLLLVWDTSRAVIFSLNTSTPIATAVAAGPVTSLLELSYARTSTHAVTLKSAALLAIFMPVNMLVAGAEIQESLAEIMDVVGI